MALTVRRSGQRIYGARNAPELVAIDLSRVDPAPIELPVTLGVDGIPHSQVWGFEVERDCEVRLRRLSDDPYLTSVALALTAGATGKRVFDVSTADGDSGWVDLGKGFYRISAALGVPRQVKLVVELTVRPRRQEITARLDGAAAMALEVDRAGVDLELAAAADLEVTPTAGQALELGGGAEVAAAALPIEMPGAVTVLQVNDTVGMDVQVEQAPVQWTDQDGRDIGPGVIVDLNDLGLVEITRGQPWSKQITIIDSDFGLPRDLRDLTLSAAVWDEERTLLWAEPAIAIADPAAGGPVTISLTALQSAGVGRYGGDPILVEITAVTATGNPLYLATGSGFALD